MRAGLNCPLAVCNPSAATPVILAQMVTLTIVRRFARATTIVAIHMRLNNKVRRKVNRNRLAACSVHHYQVAHAIHSMSLASPRRSQFSYSKRLCSHPNNYRRLEAIHRHQIIMSSF